MYQKIELMEEGKKKKMKIALKTIKRNQKK